MFNCGTIVKKPLLFSLLVWLLLFALPWTRGLAWLDWRSATLEQLSGINPAWAARDVPYQPELDAAGSYFSGISGQSQEPEDVADVQVNGLWVAPSFASLARSNDRDVLVWCARSTANNQNLVRNMTALNRRFPGDAALLAWACNMRMQNLNLSTRVPGPLVSYAPNWSVRSPDKSQFLSSYASAGTSHIPVVGFDLNGRSRWEPLVAQARRGQKLESNNGYWWWLEMTCLLGARRDEKVWGVLRQGSTKTQYNEHSYEFLLALQQAHLKVNGAVPASFYLGRDSRSLEPSKHLYLATYQVCENVMGARLAGQDKTALEGGRDLMLMGRLLRRGHATSVWDGLEVEKNAVQHTSPSGITFFGSPPAVRRPTIISVRLLASLSSSLLFYANQQKRTDITGQITRECHEMASVEKAERAKFALPSSSYWGGVRDHIVALAAGSQNIGRMLVQTLPVPLLALGVLALPLLRKEQRAQPFALPVWTRGLAWSAFALATLLGAQAVLGWGLWKFVQSWSTPGTPFWGFDFILPRLVAILPIWAFAFPACVAGVGAWWGAVFAARRAHGEAPLLTRLGYLLSSPDHRVGVVNLEPIVQIILLTSASGITTVALGLWFYLPQRDALSQPREGTWHSFYAGLVLSFFCLIGVTSSLFYRKKGVRISSCVQAWIPVARRFLAAHIALATMIYLLLAIGSAFWGAQFEQQWMEWKAQQAAPVKP